MKEPMLLSVFAIFAWTCVPLFGEEIALTDSWATETTVADDVSFGTTAAPVTPCSVVLPAARGANSLSLHPNVTTAPFSFSGADLTFGAAGLLRLFGGAAVFDLCLADTGAKGISFQTQDGTLLEYNEKFLQTANNVLFAGRRVDDVVPAAALMYIQGNYWTAEPCCVARGEGWLTAEYQTTNETQWLKSVQVRLEQQGEDIVGRATKAYYYAKACGKGTYTADSPQVNLQTPISTSADVWSYGVATMRVQPAPPATFCLKRPLNVTGPLTLGLRSHVILTNAAADGVAGTLTNAMTLVEDAALSIFTTNRLELTSACSLSDDCAVLATNHVLTLATSAGSGHTDETSVSPITNAARTKDCYPVALVAPGRRVADLVRLENPVLNYTAQKGPIIVTTDWSADRHSVTYQIHVQPDDTYVRFAFIKFYDAADGVRSVVLRGHWDYSSNYGKDFTSLSAKGDNQDIRLTDGTLVFTNDVLPSVTMNCTNNLKKQILKILPGSRVLIGCAESCPNAGSIDVGEGALLQASSLRQSATYALVAHRGSVVTLGGGEGTATVPITADGAELQIPVARGERSNEGGYYVNNLTLKNGATVWGSQIRVNKDTTYTIAGTGVQTNAAGFMACCGASNPGNFVIDVADTTGDATADYVVTGPATWYSTGHSGLTLVKRGAGTMRQVGVWSSEMTLPVRIEAGTLELGAKNVLNANNAITLAGGALAAAGCANTVGTLTLTENSAVTLAEGGSLAFADSSAIAWTAGKRLFVTAPNGKKPGLRFGTSADGLTVSQLAALRVNGDRAGIDEDGYVYGIPSGLSIIIK